MGCLEGSSTSSGIWTNRFCERFKAIFEKYKKIQRSGDPESGKEAESSPRGGFDFLLAPGS
jgi:hypothetical protein